MAEVEGDSSLESLSRLLFQDIFSLFWCHCQQPLESLTNLLQSLVTEFENRKIVDDRTQIHWRRPSISVSKIRTFVPLMLFLLSNNVFIKRTDLLKTSVIEFENGKIEDNSAQLTLSFQSDFSKAFSVIFYCNCRCWKLLVSQADPFVKNVVAEFGNMRNTSQLNANTLNGRRSFNLSFRRHLRTYFLCCYFCCQKLLVSPADW